MAITIDELKRNVFPGESGGDYNALFGYANRPGGQFAGVNLTDMSVDQALQFADPSGPYAASVRGQVGRTATPMGAYQVVGTTLRGAKEGLGLTGQERMTPQLQDAIGMWIYQNQGPGAWEAWGGGGGNVRKSSKGTGMGLLDMPAQQPRTLMDRIRSPETTDNLLAWVNSMRLNPDPNIGGMIENRQARRAEADVANRTAQFLRTRGVKGQELADLVESGGLSARDAVTMLYEPADAQGQVVTAEQLRTMYPGTKIEDGIYSQKSDGTLTKVGGGGVNVTMPGQPAIGTIPPGYQAVQDPQSGAYRFEPIPGGPAAAEVSAVEGQRSSFAATADDSIRLIDSVIQDPALPSITGMFQGRLPPLTQAGTNLNVKLNQIKGQAFLQAFESLKGGGAITAIEGKTATDAIARLDRAQDDKSYIEALNEMKIILDRGKRRALAGVRASDGDQFSGGSVINGITVGEPVQ